MRKEFAHSLTGKPEEVTASTNKIIIGYVIRDMLNFLYVTNTKISLNKWRTIYNEDDTSWTILENLSIASYIKVFKSKEFAENFKESIK